MKITKGLFLLHNGTIIVIVICKPGLKNLLELIDFMSTFLKRIKVYYDMQIVGYKFQMEKIKYIIPCKQIPSFT